MRKLPALLILVPLLLQMLTMTVYAGSNLGEWATGEALQGSSQVYYSAPWLVTGVQFVISWLCIIAFLMYYLSFLCSVVVLSNKELFWTIDLLKSEQAGGGGASGGPNRGPINGVIEKFRGGAGQEGLQGGADNFIVAILMLGINFKRYSVYKNVQADTGGAGGGAAQAGPKYQYSDTMATFFMKTLLDAVMVTFILSIALSGLLIRVWFWLGDVLVVYTDRMVQQNIIARVDGMVGNAGYNFTLGNRPGGYAQIAENIATRGLIHIRSQFPGITAEQTQRLGVAMEDRVAEMFNLTAGNVSPTPGMTRLVQLANVGRAAASPIPEMVITTEQAWGGFSAMMVTNSRPEGGLSPAHTIDLNEVLASAGLSMPGGGELSAPFLHVRFNYVDGRGQDFLVEDE
jgi:hypothetical protein